MSTKRSIQYWVIPPEANAVLASTAWIAIWWVTEAIPIAVTALLPIVLFPLSGGASIQATSAQYGHRYIFLYIGGFLLAIGIEKWGLHRRIALHIIQLIGTNQTNSSRSNWCRSCFRSLLNCPARSTFISARCKPSALNVADPMGTTES